jgi:hypothetical protein
VFLFDTINVESYKKLLSQSISVLEKMKSIALFSMMGATAHSANIATALFIARVLGRLHVGRDLWPP